ncbi:hypothetical protein HDU99_004018 [Rhizoclosmatium hyalinum]|nr:hypothetical protein HDU99_004018 [Rhizoclosmatium hyalinum]
MTCTYDHEEIVSLFLKNKSLDPSANSNEALKTACRLGNPNVTRCLLNDPRVDPTTVPDIILSTLQFGINRRCIPVLLKDPRIDPGFMNNAALAVAAFHDYFPAATLLLADPRVDPMDNKGRALINSVLLGRLNVFRLLYASPRVDFGVYANKVIQNLCIEDEKDIDVLEMLLADERVDPRAGDSAVLIKMTENCMTSAVKLLLKDGRVDAAAKNNTALQTAASLNQIEIVRLLLEQDCVDPLDGGSLCALDLSLLCHNETVATILLEDRRVIERRKNFELTLDAFEMERMVLLDFLFRQDGFMMGGGLSEMDDADWTPLFVYQNRTAVMTHCSKFLSGGKNYHEPSLDHVKVVETMFAVLHDTDVNPRTKFRSILTSWESLKIVCHTLL